MFNMKKLIAALALFVGLSANASVITIEISDTYVDVGETVSVSLLATGLSDFASFSLSFDFDTSVFNYDPSSLVTGLNLDPSFSDFGGTQKGDSLNLSLFSLFDSFSGDFLLAKFDLIAVAGGLSSFGLSAPVFEGSFIPSTVLDVDTSDTGLTKVSAPATLGLLAMAGLALVGLRRKA